jgi:hypothetical protein
VRHASAATVEELEPFLDQLRAMPGLIEKRPGVFHRKSKEFLHFHDDPSGIHADVRLGPEFERFRVQTLAERQTLATRIRLLERARV